MDTIIIKKKENILRDDNKSQSSAARNGCGMRDSIVVVVVVAAVHRSRACYYSFSSIPQRYILIQQYNSKCLLGDFWLPQHALCLMKALIRRLATALLHRLFVVWPNHKCLFTFICATLIQTSIHEKDSSSSSLGRKFFLPSTMQLIVSHLSLPAHLFIFIF